MIGSNGPRMLRATMSMPTHGTPGSRTRQQAGRRGAVRPDVDEACRAVGATRPRSGEPSPSRSGWPAAVAGVVDGGYDAIADRTDGRVGQRGMAEVLRAFAREGIAHVQLVLDPITIGAIRGLGAGPGRTRPRLMNPGEDARPRASIRARCAPSTVDRVGLAHGCSRS